MSVRQVAHELGVKSWRRQTRASVTSGR